MKPLFLLAVLLISTPTLRADETLVFLGPNGPFLISIRVQVDDEPFDRWLSSYLFSKLDTERKGVLSEDQLQLLPARLVNQLGFDRGQDIANLGHDRIDREAFFDIFRKRLPTAFLVSEKQISAVRAINILPKFDADADGHLTEKELRTALDHQMKQDIDDDRTLSAAELLPFRDPQNRGRAVAPNPDDLPFIQLVRGDERKLAERLLKYYRSAAGAGLPRSAVRMTEPVFAEDDKDQDGFWTADELVNFLQAPKHHLALTIRFSMKSRQRIEHKLLIPSPSVKVPRPERPDRLTMQLDGLPIVLRTQQYLMSGMRFTRSLCGQFFSISDADRNKALNAEEFTAFLNRLGQRVGPMVFDALDNDKDKQVTRQELYRHLDRDTIAAQSRLQVTLASRGRSMFEMLDANADRRLSPRELRKGFAQLTALDRNGDARVSRVEAASPSTYTLELGLGTPPALVDTQMNMMMEDSTEVRTVGSLNGPVWFQKMDRNRDGDVSLREFLGTAARFKKLDTDQDGLIDADEAAAAK